MLIIIIILTTYIYIFICMYIHSLYKPLALPRSAIFETRAICHGEASGVPDRPLFRQSSSLGWPPFHRKGAAHSDRSHQLLSGGEKGGRWREPKHCTSGHETFVYKSRARSTIHSLYKPLALPRSAIFETRAICHGEASGVPDRPLFRQSSSLGWPPFHRKGAAHSDRSHQLLSTRPSLAHSAKVLTHQGTFSQGFGREGQLC